MRMPPRWTAALHHPFIAVAVCGALLATAAGCDGGYDVVSGEGTLTSHGGTIHAQCIDHTRVKIVSADPAAGFTTHILVEGPSAQASLIFENAHANDYRVAINCEDYKPAMQEFEIEDTTINKN